MMPRFVWQFFLDQTRCVTIFAPAAMQFGERYFAGRDAPRDAVRAWCWFKIAAGKDAPGTAAKIAAAEARMTSEQRSAAASALAELNADLRQLAAADLQPARELPEQP
jgi:TPR repeat protein